MRCIFVWLSMWLIILIAVSTVSIGEWEKELQAISGAPIIFIAAFIFFYSLVILPSIWLIHKNTEKRLESEYRGQINSLNEQVNLLKVSDEKQTQMIVSLESGIANDLSLNAIAQPQTLPPEKALISSHPTETLACHASSLAHRILYIVFKVEKQLKEIDAQQNKLVNEEKIKYSSSIPTSLDTLKNLGSSSIIAMDKAERQKQLEQTEIQKLNAQLEELKSNRDIIELEALSEIHQLFDNSSNPMQARSAILTEIKKDYKITGSLLDKEEYSMTNIKSAKRVAKELIDLSDLIKN